MNIAFWSSVRHQSGVTSCVALLSILWAELFMEEVAVTANHICSGSLAKRLYGGSEQEEKAARKTYNYIFGEPEYFRLLYSGKLRTTLWLNDSLRFIPMEGEVSQLFRAEGLKGVNKAEQPYLMIDTACGCGLSSQRILDDAELTVILFPPVQECVDAFFQSEAGYLENSFFIIGNYRGGASFHPSYLNKQYHIPWKRIGVIPHDFGFEQAMREGSTIAYIARYMNCTRRDVQYRFMQSATKTVENLRNYAMSRRE